MSNRIEMFLVNSSLPIMWWCQKFRAVFMRFSLLVVMFILGTSKLSANDMLIQYYVPSAFGFTSGTGSLLNQFENTTVNDRLLIPLEGRMSLCSIGKFSLGCGVIAGGYIENHEFGSMNVSLGFGLFYNGDSNYKLTGWNIFVYPLYDRPIYANGKTPLFLWKAAFDYGYTFCFAPFPLSVNLFARNVLFWRDSQMNCIVDFGVSVGFYIFQDKTPKPQRPSELLSE